MKTFLALLLTPFARAARSLRGLHRLWAFSSLQAGLRQRLDRSVLVLGCPELHGSRHIRLGRNLMLYPGIYLETRDAGAIDIADDVVISRGAHIVAFAGVRIGAGSMIGEYASVRDANHRFGQGIALRRSGQRARAIEIGANVWIGRGATILPGARIGDGAVIGANAVVTHDVPAQAVVGGVPARALQHAAQS
jgi:acetyltransferase-like isoleucine patch superfamily enzyme